MARTETTMPAAIFRLPRMPRMRALPALALALPAALALAGGGAHAQSAAAPAGPVFAIKGFQVTGPNPLAEGETTRVLAPYLRNDSTLDTLQKATAALEAAFRERGFGLHRVVLPPQEVGDTVRLQVVQFSIGAVSIEGRERYSEANIRASVPELREGSAPNFRRMAVQTAIANESPGKQTQVSLRESREPDKIDATIVVKENRPWNFSLGANNTGTSATGRDRVTVAGGHSNLFDRDHHFVGAYTTSLERAGDVKQLGLSYRVPFYAWGGSLSASYTRSDVVGNFGAFSSTGAGRTVGAQYAFYLPPEGGYRSYFTVGVDDKQFDAGRIDDIPVPGQQLRRSRPLTLGYVGRKESDSAFWGYNAEVAFNLGGGSGNNLAAYASEDPRITTARWKALRAGGNYLGTAWGRWLWGVRGQVQYSPDALISGEQFGLGGSSSVRGTQERPIAGDMGLLASAELTTPELGTGLRALGFIDAGWLANNGAASLAKPASDRLGSVGIGLRYASTLLQLSLDYGRVFHGSSVPAAVNSQSPQKGDDKLHLNVLIRF